ANARRCQNIAPALLGNSMPSKTEPAYRTVRSASQPVAQPSACQMPSTTMDPLRKRRRITAGTAGDISRRHVPQGDGSSAKESSCRRTNHRRHSEDDFPELTPSSSSLSPTTSEGTLYKNGSVTSSRGTSSPDKSSESEFSPKSSYSASTYSTLTVSSADDSEPFDAQGETERLIKIHDLAEEIVAREAAVRKSLQDAEPKRNSEVPSAVPACEAPTEALSTLATSSLMPLALAAITSVRASFASQPSNGVRTSASFGKASARTSSPSSPAPCNVSSAAETVSGQRAGTSNSTSSSPSTSSGFSSSRRKKMQGVPTKSPPADDPNFRGALVRMQLKIVRGKPQLKMEHYFNNIQRRRTQMRDYAKSSDSDDDYIVVKKEEEESQGTNCLYVGPCSQQTTPYINSQILGKKLCDTSAAFVFFRCRYKKYKVRCNRCWHIPRKNENTRLHCKECGEALRFVLRKSSMP
ncbi:unnamed protein product, partial [Ixodes hexagonus]